MKRGSKVAIAVAAVGGTLMMVAPMALADTYGASGATLTGASSSQWQSGNGATGTTLDQNSSISTGQLQAQNYYNSSTSNGGNSNSQTYVANDGSSTLSTATSSYSDGGSSWTKASNYNTSGSTVTQNQSQLISSGNNEGDGASGGMQTQQAMAGTVNVNQDWTLSGGLAGSHQSQNGQGSNQSVLNQSANVQTGTTTATSYQYDVKNRQSSSNTQQYTGGQLTTNSSTYNAGNSSYTKASNYSNPVAGVSQDQSQVIGLDGNGASQQQSSWAVSGAVTDEFWQSIY